MWHLVKYELPESGKDILLYLVDGSVHEGHFIKNANKHHMNVNRFKIYKTGKTIAMKDVSMWREMPKMGFISANS